jgi:hypothetical protein
MAHGGASVTCRGAGDAVAGAGLVKEALLNPRGSKLD